MALLELKGACEQTEDTALTVHTKNNIDGLASVERNRSYTRKSSYWMVA